MAAPQKPVPIFKKILEKGSKIGITPQMGQKAREWFRDAAYAVQSISRPKFQRETLPFQNLSNINTNSIGKMYCFSYDPKHKATLPYYDIFPLIFPIEFYNDGFLGINLHYLPPGHRAQLMNALYTTINNDKYNKTTQLKINYSILKSAAQFRLFKPCIKRYLNTHLRSPFMYIPPENWDFVMMLPLARFKKKSQDVVWLDSLIKV